MLPMDISEQPETRVWVTKGLDTIMGPLSQSRSDTETHEDMVERKAS